MILYSIAALFCLFGLADATYLTVLALTGETAACSGQTGCFEVLGSAYAKVAGVYLRDVCRLQLRARPEVFRAHGRRAFCHHPVVALRPGVFAPCVLPLLPVLRRNYFPAHGTRRGQSFAAGCREVARTAAWI